MHDGHTEQVRYYALRLAFCQARPALHPAQIAACQAHLELLVRAGAITRFSPALAHGGHASAMSRADQFDRLAADRALALAIGDGAVAAAADHALALLASGGDEAFLAGVTAIGEVSSIDAMSDVIANQAVRVVEAAIDHACDPDADRRAEHAHVARVLWMTLGALAPGFGVANLTAPPLRHRLPFTDPALAALGPLIAAALGVDPASVAGTPPEPSPSAPVPVPDFSALAALRLDGWPRAPDQSPDRVVAAVRDLESGTDLATLRAPLEALIRAERISAAAGGEPWLAELADELLDRLAAAVTPTEAQALSRWSAAVGSVERAWWRLLIHTALWPAVAALAAPPDAAWPAAQIAGLLLGAEPVAALRSPVIADALARELLDSGQRFVEGTVLARPGGEHVNVVRRAAAEHAGATMTAAITAGTVAPDFAAAAVRFSDLAELFDHVAGVAARAPAAGDSSGAVVLWGRRLSLADLAGAARTAARPRPEGLW